MVSGQLCQSMEKFAKQSKQAANSRERAEALVAEMELDEKLSLVISYFPLISPCAEQFKMPMCSGFTAGVPRLGIPDLRITDASLGVANILNSRVDDDATALPSSLATGASFEPAVAFAGGAMIGLEARAKQFNVMLVGGINLTRDPWAGRNFEYIGEDPLLTGSLGGASVAGVQSNAIAGTVKHLALNSQETGRMVIDARIDLTDLRESDLLAFEIALETGRPAAVMTGYNKVNGEYCGEHAYLINQVLKDEWQFPGWVMSDWGAVHSTDKAALAGLDQESGIELDERLNGSIFFTDRLRNAICAGDVPESRLDDMVTRIVGAMIEVGAMEDGRIDEFESIDDDVHSQVAQEVAEKGAVLLRNERQALPISESVRSLAVIGGKADIGVPSGGGSSQVRSRGGVPFERVLEPSDASWFCRETYHSSSPLRALRARLPGASVQFANGKDIDAAAALAAESEVAIVFATQWQTEAIDVLTLALPDAQDELIRAVAAANPRTVVVLETGGPVLMPWLESVAAVLQAWYPGQRGGEAIARLLVGDVSPSGRLPITFPASDHQAPRPLPGGLRELRTRDEAWNSGDKTAKIAPFAVDYTEGANIGYRWYELTGQSPLFPFGFGLSYTEFELSEFEIDTSQGRPLVRLTVANVGYRTGAEVPQIYVRAADRLGRETWRLAGFARVELAPGKSQRVAIALEPRTFSNWSEELRAWQSPAGELPLAVAHSSVDFAWIGVLPLGHR